MHETLFSKEIIDVLKYKLKNLGDDSKIACVNVRLSPLSHVKPETLNAAFLQTAEAENLPAVPLNIRPLEVELRCKSCGTSLKVSKPIFICPHCKNGDFDIKQEREFFVESIELEKRTDKKL
jgi:Zn finger protein HypA/HybF involved in hydrogenase expression